MTENPFAKLLPYDVAHLILGEYIKYYHQYKRITKRAKIRFEIKDWHGVQTDARERVTMYRQIIGNTTDKVLDLLGDKACDREVWREVRQMYLEDITNFNTRNVAETFYNSIFRHAHKGLSADQELMFVHATCTYREFKSAEPIFNTFYLVAPIESTIRQMFCFYEFDVPFEDFERDVQHIVRKLKERFDLSRMPSRSLKLEVLKSVFFRNKAAYIVGRIVQGEKYLPFVMPLLNEEGGIYVDALLCEDADVSSIFSYNRAYFLVDVDIVSEMVDFLRSIMPSKSLGELYNSIGFDKHGKTVFYRDFLRHIQVSDDKFVAAPGIKGMVMSVFTLPSYNMVFKIIKDKFEPPKKMTEQQVKEKYEIVSLHDRVGRMTDSHMFENMAFDRRRFSEELLAELLADAPSKLVVTDKIVEIKHLYVEKKMIPLNIYLETASQEEMEEAIDEYGNAIKQLAAVNIFPGDMLLKNFGVTRLRRVVFYDYDEISYLTDCNFRAMPRPRNDEDEMSGGGWFHVAPEDVFPEEFLAFLISDPKVKDAFMRLHGDLLSVKFWRDMQKRVRQGEIVNVFPYRKRLRFGGQAKLAEGE
jgi:isocitrate dehydrogenase kinase/phosphatase